MDNKTMEEAMKQAQVSEMARRIDKSAAAVNAVNAMQPGAIWATDNTAGQYGALGVSTGTLAQNLVNPVILREGARTPVLSMTMQQVENGFTLQINYRTFVAKDFKEAMEVITAQAASAMLDNT